MKKRYYTLRFEYGDAYHKAGDRLMNADNALHIGQTEACEVKLPNTSQYEDAVLAVIEPREDGQGWKIIRTSPFKEHEVMLNGTPIEYVHHLEDGDHISFAGQRQELVFNIREDELYASKGIVAIGKKDNRSMIVWLAIISLAVIAFVLHQLYHRPMSNRMIESAMQSVYQIKVDSMKLVRCEGENTYVKRTAYLDNEVGTAFLATDGKATVLVTARHCIEPWLNLSDDIPMDTVSSRTPDYIKMALEASTRNIIAEYTGDSVRWKMVSYCSLRKPEVSDEVLMNLTSDQFILDNSRDHIMEYGDFNHQYFWRSLKVRPRRTDMMLGDIAYLPDATNLFQGQKAMISLASKEEMRAFCQTPNRSLRIMGRTANQTGNRQIEALKAEIKTQMTSTDFTPEGYPNTVITHDGDLSRGFSGGPVLTRKGFFGCRVIGVVSVIDKSNDNWFYSVPISEIERMRNNN